MIKGHVTYINNGLLSQEIVEAIAKQRKAHGYETYARRLHYWTSIVDRLSRLMREDEVLQKYGHEMPKEVGAELITHIGTLIIAFLEFFDVISVDSENDLATFITAHNATDLITDDDNDEEMNLAIQQLGKVDLDKFHGFMEQAVIKFMKTDQADTASNNGGHL